MSGVPLEITVTRYNEEVIEHFDKVDPEQVTTYLKEGYVNWVHVRGLGNAAALNKLGSAFGLHALVMEDILNTDHLPKVEELDDYLFLTLKVLTPEYSFNFTSSQVSFVLGKNVLLTFQENVMDLFSLARERLKSGKGRSRSRKCDYLFYLFIDEIVDNYYLVLDNIGEAIEKLEDMVMSQSPEVMGRMIIARRRDLGILRRTLEPMADEIRKIMPDENGLIEEGTQRYLKDVHDHLLHIRQSLGLYQEMMTGIWELNMSNNANRLNDVMRSLTVIATIFIPLTFVVGIYGMNFKHMPEIEWKWGYPFVMAVMLVLGIWMYVYMKRKKWF
jgi:magnesium transporter